MDELKESHEDKVKAIEEREMALEKLKEKKSAMQALDVRAAQNQMAL